MFRKLVFTVIGLVFIVIGVYSNDIIGIYREESTNIGILIEPSDVGDGFIVHRVFLNSSGTIRQKFEWQSAFIPADTLPSILFYWKSGRYEDSMPNSNKLIIYKLVMHGKTLVGTFYFPEETRMPSEKVSFIKIDN